MYKYAIIGFGGLGKLHLSNLAKLERERGDFSLQAICGTDANTFKENVKLNLGTVDLSDVNIDNCRFYQDYKELIEVEKPDFILSALPTYLHKEVAVYALSRGIHVFSEKPMALSVEDCEEMVRVAKENGKYLMIGQCLRFDAAYSKLKEYVDNKTFGEVYRAEFTRYSQKPSWTWNNWILDPAQSGGCILDMHIHDVDLINWIFGMPKALRSAITEKKAGREAVFTQYFYDDLLVLANADWSMTQSFPFEARCLVNFEEATLVISNGKITVYKDEESFVPELPEEDYFVKEMKAFLKMVIDGEECNITSSESVLDSVKLAMKEIEASKSGKTVVC